MQAARSQRQKKHAKSSAFRRKLAGMSARLVDRPSCALRFAEEARRFVEWADGAIGDPQLHAADALRRVLALYTAALQLPQPWSQGVKGATPEVPHLAERLARVQQRAASLPLQYYSEIFSPLVLAPEAPVVGDLADDLADIYRDVATGLHLLDTGRVDDALWQWGFNFQIHWGQHASSAIRALHCYLAQEDPSGLAAGA